MSDCKCITQEIRIVTWKKKEHWYEGTSFFPLYRGSEKMIIHADSIEELESKRNEVLEIFKKKYPERDVEVWKHD